MKQLYRLSILIAFIAIYYQGSAQDQFERRYPSTQTNVVTSSLQALGSSYASLGVEVDADGDRNSINVIFFDKKGTIDNSYSVFYGDTSLLLTNRIKIKDVGQILGLSNGRIVFSAVLDKDSLNKVITIIDNFGNHLYTIITGQVSDGNDLESNPSVLVEVPTKRVFHAHTIDAGNNTTDIQLTSIDSMGVVQFVRQISLEKTQGTSLNERIIQMELAMDSTIMLLGSTDDPDVPLFLSNMDTAGNILWTRTYNGDFDRTLATEGLDLTQLLDSTWVILGSVLPNTTLRNSGVLIKVDRMGEPLLTELISPSSVRYQLYPNGIVGMLDTTVVVSMMRLDMISGIYQPLIVNYNLDSVIIYQTLLDTCISEDPDLASLVTVDSMSATLLYTTQKDNFLIPNLSKVDATGRTQCEDFVDAIIIDSVDFTGGELIDNITSMMIEDSMDVEVRPFGGYSPPVLTVQDTIFCPEDPIVYLVDATVRGGVAYLWDDGATDSIRLFMEEGMFSVTVTVAEDICFTLCDTLTISQLMFPMVEITKNFTNYCSNETGILNANTSGAAIESFMWSTGATDRALVVDGTPMDYSVTVTDMCGNEAIASTSVSEEDYLQPNPLGLVSDIDNVCVDGTILITATQQSDPAEITWSTGASNTLSISVDSPGQYTADVGGLCPDSETITLTDDDFLQPVVANIVQDCETLTVEGSGFMVEEWSTGETTLSINISEADIYTVTLIDECGDQQAPIEIEIRDDELPAPISATVTLDCGEPRMLRVSGSGFTSQIWSTGATSETIEITEPGSYSVTVTGDAISGSNGVCQNELMVLKNVDDGQFNASTGCLLWPNALQPMDRELENTVFGPKIQSECTNLVSFEMRIYNRWGKNIYTTNNPEAGWNGAINGDPQPGGVYYYWATYDDGVTTCERKGDLTLIR